MPEDLANRIGLAVPSPAWLAEPLPEGVREALTRLARAPGVARLAVMPDVHLAEAVCVGVVLATRGEVYPQAIGADIGCGITAAPLDACEDLLRGADAREAALCALQQAVPIIRWGRNGAPALPQALRDGPPSGQHARLLQRDGLTQFGTLGRGNHFAEVQAASDGQLWLTVHSGSRAMGPQVMQHAMQHAQRAAGGLRHLDGASDAGRVYLADAAWCVEYAKASRVRMIEHAGELLKRSLGVGVRLDEAFGTCHNLVRAERHMGEQWLVHRKGASPAAVGEASIIPGSMGSLTFHVEGRGSELSLSSSSHGAGRRLSRAEARRFLTPDEVRRQLRGVCYDPRLAKGALCEEAPDAYRDIDKVMRAQGDLVVIDRRLRTLVCHKGG